MRVIVNVGKAFVDIDGDFTSLFKSLDGVIPGLTGKFGSIGKAATVGLAGVGVAAVGAGKALYDIGSQFDDAYDSIRVSTGKTGKELDGLKGAFKDVVKNVPTDFNSAATAIGQVSDRLGLTGKPLEKLSSQFLELSRITKTDLKTNITTVTRVFGDWSIATGKQAGAMDELFRASQKTGVPVDQLGQLIVKYGAPLRQLGFSFEQSAAMVGKFEKEGVNTQLVMGSLRIALGKMATAGEQPVETFKRITGEIKNAGSAGEANALALKLFGARAGPDMAAAIREGRFELGNLTKQISGGHDTILGAAKDTEDFSEKWLMFKNKVLVGLEPLAISVFNAVGASMDKLPAIAAAVAGAFEQIKAAFTGTGQGAGQLEGVLASLSDAFSGFVTTAKVLWGAFGKDVIAILVALAKDIAAQIQAVVKILQGLADFVSGVLTGDWGRAWTGIKEIFSGFATSLLGAITAMWTAIKALFDAGLTLLKGVWSAAWDAIKGVAAAAVGAIASVLSTAWTGIKSAATTAWDAIREAILTPFRAARDAMVDIGTGIATRLASAWSTIKGAASTAWDAIRDAVLSPIRAARDALPDIVTGMGSRLASGFKSIASAVGGFASDVAGKITGAFKGAANLVIKFVNAIISAINLIPGVPNIGHVAALAQGGAIGQGISGAGSVPGFARGGSFGIGTMPSGPGGRVNRPLAIVGEEAPRHAEFVIPTNPAYRGRALGLYGQLSRELGVPGFNIGGILSGAGNLASGAAGAVGSVINTVAGIPGQLLSQGVDWILHQLPGAGDLPSWLKGTGGYVLDKVTGWIRDHVSSLLATVTGGGGSDSGQSSTTGLVPQVLAALSWARGHGWAGSVTSGFRSLASQQYLWDNAAALGLIRGVSVAQPGTSEHERGRAVDVTDVPGFQRAMASAPASSRLIWRGPTDPVHFSVSGHAMGGLVGGSYPFVGSFENGGPILQDGFAYVHQGETVVPAGGGTERFQFFLDGKEIDVRVVKIADDRDRARAARYRAGVA